MNGYENLDAPELPVTGGIKLFNKSVQEQTNWPAAMVESWKEAVKNKETGVEAKIEMAGNSCFEEIGCISTFRLLNQKRGGVPPAAEGQGHIPWLEKLGSGPCYIGNDENPIHINLTTGGQGTPGHLTFNEAFSQVQLADSRLVDIGWTIEPASYPTGCSGAYGSYLIAALENVLEVGNLPKTGIVVLQGDLHTAETYSVAEEGVASGEL